MNRRRHIGFVSLLLLTIISGSGLLRAEDFSRELPRVPPVEPADTLRNFQVADGFEIQLVASEPLVNSPVAIQWDARGRLFVCEMRGYSENRDDAVSRISLLVDSNDDGVYDTSTVFADHLLWPTALFPFDGGLFVADAPDVWYFRDDDGDGVSDTRQLVLTGFSTSNVQGLLNSFHWGLDNRIHLACGTAGGKVRRVAGDEDGRNEKAVEVRGYDLAFDPRTFEFERTSGGAQHGMCFDDWGRKFVSSNSDHLQQVMYEDRYIGRNRFIAAPGARLSIAEDGPQAEVFRISPVEPWRIVRTRLRVAGLVGGPVEGGGRAAGYFTGATGATIYRGDVWPDAFRSLAIVGDVGSNLIHRKRLSPNGVPMIARRMDHESEFVASRDIWFRPSQFECGPDGALTVVDVCREVIEHPKSLPPEIKQHLDLTAGRDRGRLYRIVPDDFQHRATVDLATQSTGELVKSLAHPNAWHRETAARLIFERQGKTVVSALREMVSQSDSPLGRLHAMYALDGLAALDASILIVRLHDPHPQVVRHAIRLSERLPEDDVLLSALAALVHHPDIAVRYQLAFTLGEFNSPERHQWLAEIVSQNPDDRWIQAAVGSSVGDSAVDLFVRLVAQQSTTGAAIVESLASQIRRQNLSGELLTALRAINGAKEHPRLLTLLGKLVGDRDDIERLIATGALPSDLVQSIQTRIQVLTRAAIQIADDPGRSLADRRDAVQSLQYGNVNRVLEIYDDSLATADSSELQIAWIQLASSLDTPEVITSLIGQWSTWSPRVRRVAEDVLFASESSTRAVVTAIEEKQLNADDFAVSRWQTISKSRNQSISAVAKLFLESQQSRTRDDVIAQYRPALDIKGDIQRGQNVFKQQCAGCHQVDGVGHSIGPSLAAAQTRGAESILVNVLDPNREVNPQYAGYVILTQDGRAHAGMIVSENSNSVTLRRAEAETETILRGDIEQIRGTGLSFMPEGMEKAIDVNAMADLIAYLLRR
ncbi:PVC-type heme-binding CxxCH protein [Stieleria varia]|nr:PVC-type heme-binding CxxCH protein [Stieleria varia]